MAMDMDMTGMSSMNMPMTGTATATGTMSSSTGMSMDMGGMDMGGMGGMDMGQDAGCKVSMLWNWNTIDACFLSKSWHVTSRGMFAGSCIGVICLVLCLEFLRRLGREYDAFIVKRARLRSQYLSNNENTKQKLGGSSGSSLFPFSGRREQEQESSDNDNNNEANKDQTRPTATATTPLTPFETNSNDNTLIIRPTFVEQIVRSVLHLFQFAVAYFIMLLAMYFNGYIIICIFIGAFLGSFLFSWEPMAVRRDNDATAVTGCCG